MTEKHPKLAFIGGGNMARSIIGGLIASNWPATQICVADPDAGQRKILLDKFGVRCVEDNQQCITDAKVVIMAVKPQMMRQVVSPMAAQLTTSMPLIISIAAGIRSDQLLGWIGTQLPMVRVMPNTPALVNKGVSGLYANALCSAEDKQIADSLMQAVGEVVWVDQERLIDTVTGVSGSGPAYFFKMMELMLEQGIASGLTPDAARTLVIETALGAATLMRQSNEHPAELRRQVTSPAGTTEAGINEMQHCGIDHAVKSGVRAAIERSEQLSKEFGGNL